MQEIPCNKLVRDLIPDKIKESNKACIVSKLDDTQYLVALKSKLVEESAEVLHADTKEEIMKEMADVLEVLDAIQDALRIDSAEVEIAKLEKAKKHGQFKKKIFLHSVIEGIENE